MRKALSIAVFAIMAAGAALAGQQTQGKPATGAPAQPAPGPKQRSIKSQDEGKAVQAVAQAPTADARIAAAEDFIVKFPKSDFLAMVLFAEAQAYEQKNDYEKSVIFAERALQSDPDDASRIQTLLLLSGELAQHTREFDLDREEKLGRVDKYANEAIELTKVLQKPNPQIPDEQWNSAKEQMISDAHESLGMAAVVRKNYDVAISQFKTAMEIKAHNPVVEVRLAQAYNRAGKYDDAIALCDQVMAQPNGNPTVKSYAQAERARAMQAKGASAPKPAAPAAGAAASPSAPAPAPAPAPKQ